MRVEIELFNAEGRWDLALFINVIGVEKLLFSMIFENVTCVGILQITAHIRRMTCLVNILSLGVLKDLDIAAIISVKLTKNIMYVKSPVIGVWRHLNWMVRLAKVLQRLSGHHDLCLKSLIFFF